MALKDPTDTPSDSIPSENGENSKTPATEPQEPVAKPKATPRAKATAKPVVKAEKAEKPEKVEKKPVRTPRPKPVPKPPTEDEATGKVDPPAPEVEPDDTEATEGGSGGQTATTPNIAERVLDTFLGYGVINAEVIEKAATRLGEVVNDLPAYLAELEAKGRPLREQLFSSLKFDFPTTRDVFEMADEVDETESTPEEIETKTESKEGEKSEKSEGKGTTSEKPAPAEPTKPKAVCTTCRG